MEKDHESAAMKHKIEVREQQHLASLNNNFSFFPSPVSLSIFLCHIFPSMIMYGDYHGFRVRLNSEVTVVPKTELCCLSLGSSQFNGIKQYSSASSEHKGETWALGLILNDKKLAFPTTRVSCSLIHLSFMSVPSLSSQSSLLT